MNELPEGWREIPLGQLCRPRQWTTIGKDDFTEEGFPVFGANGYLGYFSEPNHLEDTIIITCRGATCGQISWVPGPAYITGNAMCLDEIDHKKTSARYLYHYLKFRGAEDYISGSAQPQIIRGDIERLPVVAPEFDEQTRIAAVLDEADRSQRAALRLTDLLAHQKRGLMQKLLTGDLRLLKDADVVA